MGFWGEVGKVLVNSAIQVVAGEFIRRQLNKLIKKQVVNNLVKLAVFLAAILISYLGLFGQSGSLLISSLLILALLAHSALKIVPRIPLVLRLIAQIPIKMIFQGSGFSELLAGYLEASHPVIFKLKAKADTKLKGWVPTADDLVEYVWGYIGKQALVFAISLGLFMVSFGFIVKPMLQSAVMGVHGIKTYVVPFAMAIDYIFKTNIMVWVMG
jgi:hypothetical protein